jgi:uncharacterized cupin superfamily protein
MNATAHWDDALTRDVELGPIGAKWHMLGRAAGSDRVGLRRIQVSPGKQATPVHAHFGEEELFYVLAGGGWSWQEGGVFEIAAGDVILHPEAGWAHTVVAGDEGIDVLAFGDNLRHEAVRFPRTGVGWVGGMIFDVFQAQPDTPHPQLPWFHLEAEAGPLQIPAQPDPRPRTIRNVADVEPVTFKRERIDVAARMLGRPLGARRIALNLAQLAPGSEGASPHCHSAVEELFVVLEGDGVLVLGNDEEEHPVRAGSLVSRPPGTGVAHGFRAGAGGMTLLMFSDVNPNDMCFYPRSGKVLLRGLGITILPQQVGYWDE